MLHALSLQSSLVKQCSTIDQCFLLHDEKLIISINKNRMCFSVGSGALSSITLNHCQNLIINMNNNEVARLKCNSVAT